MLLVTHNVMEAERAVDRLAIIDRGKVLATGTVADIKGKNGTHMRLELTLEPGMEMPVLPAGIEYVAASHRRVITKVEKKR